MPSVRPGPQERLVFAGGIRQTMNSPLDPIFCDALQCPVPYKACNPLLCSATPLIFLSISKSPLNENHGSVCSSHWFFQSASSWDNSRPPMTPVTPTAPYDPSLAPFTWGSRGKGMRIKTQRLWVRSLKAAHAAQRVELLARNQSIHPSIDHWMHVSIYIYIYIYIYTHIHIFLYIYIYVYTQ